MSYLQPRRSMPLNSRTHKAKPKGKQPPTSNPEPTKPGPAYSSQPTDDEEACPLVTTFINNQSHWVHPVPFLRPEELKGLITLNEQIISIEWGVFSSYLSNCDYKAAIERIAAEAAVMMKQTEVRICGNLRKASWDGKQVVLYERHVTIWFPNLGTRGRTAHVYVGPNYLGMEWKELRIWRREGKPAVVLC
ncbi:uncharacterized protein PAC_07597 [Phialocephala subalpina]|uniref:Uncharacterized protein n=1 Tax=Phialocephala subalpina TaxID=576137 RepID=A0A1L7WY77_9HELO|nr:uncharacterized protein PAC_07597 [Phialocephala subalpina]